MSFSKVKESKSFVLPPSFGRNQGSLFPGLLEEEGVATLSVSLNPFNPIKNQLKRR